MSVLSDNGIVLVTDRKKEDVDYLKELTHKMLTEEHDLTPYFEIWAKCDLKGAYNYTDANRVIQSIELLSDAIIKAGNRLDIKPLVIERETGSSNRYELGDIPTEEQFQIIFHNLTQIKGALGIPSWWTAHVPKTAENMTVHTANDIEWILKIVDEALEKIRDSWYYCGEMFCGEV